MHFSKLRTPAQSIIASFYYYFSVSLTVSFSVGSRQTGVGPSSKKSLILGVSGKARGMVAEGITMSADHQQKIEAHKERRRREMETEDQETAGKEAAEATITGTGTEDIPQRTQQKQHASKKTILLGVNAKGRGLVEQDSSQSSAHAQAVANHKKILAVGSLEEEVQNLRELLLEKDKRIAELEEENKRLKEGGGVSKENATGVPVPTKPKAGSPKKSSPSPREENMNKYLP